MAESDMPTPIDAVRALAEELMNIVGIAQVMVQSGRNVDLTGLGDQVGLLCAKSLDLPPDDGRRVRPRLIALSGSIEALSRALVAKAAPWSSASLRS